MRHMQACGVADTPHLTVKQRCRQTQVSKLAKPDNLFTFNISD